MARKAKKSPPINSGSMADISFLLLTFFLLTSSIDSDVGIIRRLPPPLPDNQVPPDVKERNVMAVLVNFNDELRVNNESMDISELRQATKIFLSNPYNDPHKSEQVEREFTGLGVVTISRGVVSLLNDNGTTYEMYIKVQNELTAAVNELRDEFSRRQFGVRFEDLRSQVIQEAIQRAIPIAISEAEPKDFGGGR